MALSHIKLLAFCGVQHAGALLLVRRLTAARLVFIALLALPVGISYGLDLGNAQAGVSERGHVYLV